MTHQELLAKAMEAQDNGQIDQAADICRAILSTEPNQPDALLLLGILAAKTSRHAISVKALRQVLDLNPDEFDARIWLGIVLHQLGEFDEARGHFEHARRLNPDSFAPYVGILRGHKVKSEDRDLLDEAARVLSLTDSESDDARQLTYGVAKAFNDLGEYETAIGYYDRANTIAARLQKPAGFDRQLHRRKLNEMIRVFSKAQLNVAKPVATKGPQPIFIIGMIRSGTTLVEQILSRHPSVQAGGEIRYWIESGPATLIQGHAYNVELGGYLAWDYVASLSRVAEGRPFVTDKMPLNYMLAGLLHFLFPNAPIIHCHRNPIDTCLSILMTPYAAPPDFAYDREDIAFAYREYQRVMAHWHEAMPPGRMLDLRYEDLVSDPEKSVRELLGYCQLDWDEACLSPEKNERAVDTPSRWQVRQPVYKSSVGRYHHYAPWLGAIGELA